MKNKEFKAFDDESPSGLSKEAFAVYAELTKNYREYSMREETLFNSCKEQAIAMGVVSIEEWRNCIELVIEIDIEIEGEPDPENMD